MSSPLEFLDQQEAERAKELKKLAQNHCDNHTQCGEDCLPDCPHYAEKKPEQKAKPAFKYGLEISEPQKRLWVGEVINGSVHRCLYSDTWNGNRMKGTREKIIENAKLIVKALNTFDASVDAPYCHDLEQRIELLEMQLEEAQAKAAAYDRLMSMNSISENDIQIVLDGNAWCAYRLPFRNLQEDNAGFGDTPQMALTALLESELPDGWEEK